MGGVRQLSQNKSGMGALLRQCRFVPTIPSPLNTGIIPECHERLVKRAGKNLAITEIVGILNQLDVLAVLRRYL
jgi:hypothetical protein